MRDFEADSYGLPRIKWLRRLLGKLRLKGGFCPACYSSPPLKNCRVCLGTHNYAYRMQKGDKILWRKRFEKEYLSEQQS